MSNEQQVIVVRQKRTGVVAGLIAGVLALLGIFSVGLIFVPLAILVALIGSTVAVKNFNIGGVGVNVLSWVLIGVGVAVSPGIWVAMALVWSGASDLSTGSGAIREQVQEGVAYTGGAKAAVSEYYYDTGKFAADNADAGLSPAHVITGRYVSSVAVKDGSIFVFFGSNADPVLANNSLMFIPKVIDGQVSWECSTVVAQKYLPDSCESLLDLLD